MCQGAHACSEEVWWGPCSGVPVCETSTSSVTDRINSTILLVCYTTWKGNFCNESPSQPWQRLVINVLFWCQMHDRELHHSLPSWRRHDIGRMRRVHTFDKELLRINTLDVLDIQESFANSSWYCWRHRHNFCLRYVFLLQGILQPLSRYMCRVKGGLEPWSGFTQNNSFKFILGDFKPVQKMGLDHNKGEWHEHKIIWKPYVWPFCGP